MQKFITFLFLTVFSISSFAFGPQVKLSVSSMNSYALRIIVDGHTYSYDKSRGDADFIISNLIPGNHRVQIYRLPERAGHGGLGSNAIRVLYDANILLRPQYFTDLMINRFDRVFKDEMKMEQTTENPYPQHYPPDDPNHPNQPYPGYNVQMTNESFNAFKATLKNESFDQSRLNIAKQAATNNYFSAAQVKEVMRLFSFDEGRLEIAKAFYSRTVDKGNYFIVNDAFSFSSSKDALAEFIRQNP